ncbi:hypothetical protein ABZ851_36850 [Streptomyces sp. NPDC047049]|uniref:hypothetical protein n=1 Tax=Streptomyces sp. NPDC047049 TaxID=3156688 RepID=UPI00340CD3E8
MSVPTKTLGELIAEAAEVAAAASSAARVRVFALEPPEVARVTTGVPVDDLVALAASLDGSPAWAGRFVDRYAAGLVLGGAAV